MSPRRLIPSRETTAPDAFLTRLSGEGDRAFPPGISARGEGGKFTPEGERLVFPGNTFLCHVDPTSHAHKALTALHEELVAGPSAQNFRFLPPSSFHMTVFCGVSGDPLGADGWPEGIALGTRLEEITDRYLALLPNIEGPEHLTIRADHLKAGYSLHVEPAETESFDALWTIRDRLADLTGLHRPDHDEYQFHISMGYRLRYMDRSEAEEIIARSDALFETYWPELQNIRLGRVEFCRFETMDRFETLVRL